MSAVDGEHEQNRAGDRSVQILFRYLEDEPVGTVVAGFLVLAAIVGGLASIPANAALIGAAAIVLLGALVLIASRQHWKNPVVDIGVGLALAIAAQYVASITKLF